MSNGVSVTISKFNVGVEVEQAFYGGFICDGREVRTGYYHDYDDTVKALKTLAIDYPGPEMGYINSEEVTTRYGIIMGTDHDTIK